jgi:hypothetical protein
MNLKHHQELLAEIRSVVQIVKKLNADPDHLLIKAKAQNDQWKKDPERPTEFELQVIVNEECGLEPPIEEEVVKQVEAAPVLYPMDIYKDTLAGEFAEQCTKGNLMPSELFIETFLTVLCGVVGNRVYGDHKGMEQARQYLVIVAPPQNGKDVAIDAAEDVFRAEEFDGQTSFFTHGKPSYNHIGVKAFNPGSEVSIINAGLVCQRLLATPYEFGSLYEKSGIAGSGNSLLETFLGGWDSSWAKFSTAKQRKEVPERVFLSLMTSIQPDRLQGMPVSSGLYCRIIWLTYPPLNVVASLPTVDYGAVQKKLFEKLLRLENTSCRITTSPEASMFLNEWFLSVKLRNYEDTQIFARINIIAMRRALILAWLQNETTITPELMGGVCRWCDWQLSVREELFIEETDNPLACMQEKIRKALRTKGSRTREQLRKDVHAARAGTWIFNKGLEGLLFEGDVVELPTARRNSMLYALGQKEKEQ